MTSPYAEIALAAPAALPTPGVNEGSDGTVLGANLISTVETANVTPQGETGRFNPNWSPTTTLGNERLAWASYWLNMTTKQEAEALLLNWLDIPADNTVWVGLANWDENIWVWRKLTSVDAVPQPATFAPYMRDSDSMLACTVLVIGDTPTTLDSIRTDQNTPPPAPDLLNVNAPLGVNLEGVQDWSPGTMFVDVFKTSRTWIPQDAAPNGPWDNGHAINVDSDGWVTSLDPGQAAAAVMMANTVGVYPAGEYICLYDGEGTLEFKVHGSVAWSTPGRVGVTVDGLGLVNLRIIATNPDNYIRNIRFIMPGFETTYETEPFHPDFIAGLANFNVLRFMDWGETNSTTVTTWSDRTTLATSTQTRNDHGACLELMVDLCNATLSDAWICIPHLADDDYVQRAAVLIRDRLDPRLRVFVEYSNEVWNSAFPAASYARTQGLALGLSSNSFEAQLRFYSQRSQEIQAIFSTEFSAQSNRHVRVAAGQSSNPWVGTTILDWDGSSGTVNSSTAADHFDMYATAPYFGGYLGRLPQATLTASMPLADVLAACDADSLANNGPGGTTATNATNVVARGISLIAYEGGQHLVGVGSAKNDQVLTDLFLAANRAPDMRQVYADDMRRWSASNGGLFMAFQHFSTYSNSGSWGLMESLNQTKSTAPKWLGLMDWLAELPASQ